MSNYLNILIYKELQMKMGFDIKENRNTKRIEVPKDFTNAML